MNQVNTSHTDAMTVKAVDVGTMDPLFTTVEKPADQKPELVANPAKSIFRLTKPLVIDGAEITELMLDFDKLSATDTLNIDQQMTADGIVVSVKSALFSAAYCLYIAARASGININDLKRLSFLDTNRLVEVTQNFMATSGSRG